MPAMLTRWRLYTTLLLLSLGFLTKSVHAQAFDHFTIDDGLSVNAVYAFAEDHDGFMWIGTRDGLNRFDGYSFQIFKDEDMGCQGFVTNNIQALHVHSSGDLWIGLRRGGLLIRRQQSQKFELNPVDIDTNQSIRLVSIESFFEDDDGTMWVGTGGLGVLHFDTSGRMIQQFASFAIDHRYRLQEDHCFSFVKDKIGRLWMGTYGSYIHYYDERSDSVVSVTSEIGNLYSYRKKLLIQGDTLYVGTEGQGLFLYDLSSDHFILHMMKNLLIRDMVATSSGLLYFSTDGHGLYAYDPITQHWSIIRHTPGSPNSLNTNALYDLFEDHVGNIWIGTFNGGINVLKNLRPPFHAYLPRHPDLSQSGTFSVLSFLEESDGNLLIGTDGYGLWTMDIQSPNPSMYKWNSSVSDTTSGQVITSLYRDAKDNLWIGAFSHGLTRISSHGQVTLYRMGANPPHHLPINNIWDIEEDVQGRLWIAILGGGVCRLNPHNDQFIQYENIPGDSTSLSDWNARVLLSDSQGRLWIGTEDGGLNLYNAASDGFQHFNYCNESGTPTITIPILSLYEDRDGQLWIGTEGSGLALLDEEAGCYAHQGLNESLTSGVIHAIQEDQSGRLWLSTNEGLISYEKSSGRIQHYDQHDGLTSNQFNSGASIVHHSGSLLYGNIRGINGFRSDQIHLNENPPTPVFTQLNVLNKRIDLLPIQTQHRLNAPLNNEPKLKLQYQDNVIAISMSSIEWTNPAKNRCAYRLYGFESQWDTTSTGHYEATYTNLDPGQYVFELAACNNHAVWNEEIKRIHIDIAPPYYATWWFRLSVIMLIGYISVLILRIRDIRRKERHAQELLVAEQKLLQLQNETLNQEVRGKHAELSAALLQTAHKNDTLNQLKSQLAELIHKQQHDKSNKRDFEKLIRKINDEINSPDYWNQFQINFNEVHQEFVERLHSLHPNLTQNDLRLSCLIKINLTNREIASIQNISLGGVEKSKFRLKKKLQLSNDEDLHHYILSIA